MQSIDDSSYAQALKSAWSANDLYPLFHKLLEKPSCTESRSRRTHLRSGRGCNVDRLRASSHGLFCSCPSAWRFHGDGSLGRGVFWQQMFELHRLIVELLEDAPVQIGPSLGYDLGVVVVLQLSDIVD